MIDIHAHILPGVDDGSLDMEESIEMAVMAAESGVKYLAATPHCNIPGMYDNYWNHELLEAFKELRRAVSEMGIPLQIIGGMEAFATPDLPKLLREKKVLTLNRTRYFLVEFAFDEDPGFCSRVLRECRDSGFLPVIAHPERYEFVQDAPEYVHEWVMQGYGTQVNKGSILGRFGRSVKETADILLEHQLVSCVASDAHSAVQRTTEMAEIREYLLEVYGASYTRLLVEENPLRICSGKALVGGRPLSFE